MRVVAHDPTAPHGLSFDVREAPHPAPHQALVRVASVSLNLGEVAYLSNQSEGYVPGWDAAGVVLERPRGEAAIAAIDPSDIAAIAAATLTKDGYLGKALELSGPEALTPAQQVAILADGLGRPLRYEPQLEAEARAQMGRSMPKSFVDAQFRFFSAGEFDDSGVVDTVQRITGRPAGTLRAWVAEHRQELA